MLKMVTMTGADDFTEPQALSDISKDFPFVEWGVLASATQVGSGRFPSTVWICEFAHMLNREATMNASLHLCGGWVRKLLVGDIIFPPRLMEEFERVQLNFHAENTHCAPVAFWNALSTLGGRQFIFQIDGAGGNKHLESILRLNDEHNVGKVDAVPLFDISGGEGVLPGSWPHPRYTVDLSLGSKFISHGYAGGLGPHNLAEQLPLIIEAAGDCDIWIDMETHVRTNEKFDLDKVEQCLKIVAPYVNV